MGIKPEKDFKPFLSLLQTIFVDIYLSTHFICCVIVTQRVTVLLGDFKIACFPFTVRTNSRLADIQVGDPD